MDSKLKWLAVLLAALAISACGSEDDDDEDSSSDTSSGSGDSGSQTQVTLAIGTGSGSSFNSGNLTVGTASLSAGGSTSVSVSIVNSSNGNALYTDEIVAVAFTSSCAAEGKASFSNEQVSTALGTATTTYTAEGCVGDDTIVASVNGATASNSVTVAVADVNAISFTGSDFVNSIAYTNSGTSSQPTFTTVEFQLTDANGFAVEGQDVEFSISSAGDNHGATLSSATDFSDENGLVAVRLNAGASAANVRVTATFTTISAVEISTQSPPISINTGPVDVNSFSLSVSDASVKGAYGTNGATTTLSVYLADRHNNPVADGTVVSFWTEYGSILPTCPTSSGSCSVTWTSSGERPIDGLSTVVAYTVGEDSFIDSGQKNGVYNIAGEAGLSADETFITNTEMYYDLNYDGYDSTSFTDAGTGLGVDSDLYDDYNGNNTYDSTSAVYRGALCSDGAETAGHCAETSIRIWEHSQLALNTRTPAATVEAGPWTTGNFYTVNVTDSLGNFPPVGTTVTVEAMGNAEADIDVFNTVGSIGESGPFGFDFLVAINEVTTNGDYRITVTIPDGNSILFTRQIQN